MESDEIGRNLDVDINESSEQKFIALQSKLQQTMLIFAEISRKQLQKEHPETFDFNG